MPETETFTPPYPKPHRTKLSAVWRFMHGWNSWIHTLFEKSYSMQMGHVRTRKLDIYTVNDLGLVREIIESRSDDFPKHRMQHEMLCPLLGDSTFTSNGAAWRRRRRMIDPAFAHTRLARSFPDMQAAAGTMISRLLRQSPGVPVAVDPLMTHVTADIVFRTILSGRLEEDGAAEIFDSFAAYQDVTQKITTCRIYGLPAFWLTGRQTRAAEAIRARLAVIIGARYRAYHESAERLDDVLGSLLDARVPGSEAAFTEAELVNEVAMLFLAGHETSASALTWSLYLLACCPHLQEKLRAEIDAQRGRGEPLLAEDLKQLTALRNVFKETLRLYPPVSFLPRQTVQDEYLREKFVRKGAMVTIAPWLLHRHRKAWQSPDLFDPGRFDDPAQAGAIRDAYLPFGRGPRICVGQGFAMQEATLVLAEILRRFRLTSRSNPEPVSRITLRAKRPILIAFAPIA